MIQVRNNVFETNSSSTHSISITSEENFNAWKEGLVKYDEWENSFTAVVEMTDTEKEACKEEYQRNKPSFYKEWEDLSEDDKNAQYMKYAEEHTHVDNDFLTYQEWKGRHSGCEFFTAHHTTEHGDKVVAFGYAGYDG